MLLPKPFLTALAPLAAALGSMTVLVSPVMASDTNTSFIPKIVNYTTAIPDQTEPFLMPYGYTDTGRSIPQVVMAGVSPSIIHTEDTSFEILALVRPGVKPLQKVVLDLGNGSSPLFNLALKHINTLKNGDQFWKITYSFEKGAFNNAPVIPIQWGNGTGDFHIQASDDSSEPVFTGNPFPRLSFGSSISQQVALDTSKDDVLTYDTTSRVVPQIVMAGVSPAIVDIADSSFDIVALLRPGIVPVQNVFLKQGDNNLFNIALEKQKVFTNGDEIWTAKYSFAPGSFGTSTLPIVWGTGPGNYSLQVVDVAQQSATAYPVLRSGNFPAQP